MEMNSTLLDHLPALPPPPGVIPNFVNPYSEAQSGIIENVICIILTTTIVWVKMYTKVFVMRDSGWEDCRCPALPFAEIGCTMDDLTLTDTMLASWVSQIKSGHQRMVLITSRLHTSLMSGFHSFPLMEGQAFTNGIYTSCQLYTRPRSVTYGRIAPQSKCKLISPPNSI